MPAKSLCIVADPWAESSTFCSVDGTDDIGTADSLSLAERVRLAIAGIAARKMTTVSIGVATCPTDAGDFDYRFDGADKRLDDEKSAGRNRVVGAEALPDDVPGYLAEAG